jgi:Flp pilus assembly pilin Flp
MYEIRAPPPKAGHVNVILARLERLLGAGERGQTMAEYAVVLAVITIALVVAFTALGSSISAGLSQVTGRI